MACRSTRPGRAVTCIGAPSTSSVRIAASRGSRPTPSSSSGGPPRGARSARRSRGALDVSDGSRGDPRRAGSVSDLRDGARADGADRRPESPELADMSRRFLVSLGFTVPLFLLAMGDMVPGNPLAAQVSARALAWVQLLLAAPVVLYGGWPFLAAGSRVASHGPPQHVHADRDRGGQRVRLQARSPPCFPACSRTSSAGRGRSGGVLRGRRRHRDPRAAGAGARAARAFADRRSHPRAARVGAGDGPSSRRCVSVSGCVLSTMNTASPSRALESPPWALE